METCGYDGSCPDCDFGRFAPGEVARERILPRLLPATSKESSVSVHTGFLLCRFSGFRRTDEHKIF